MPRQSAIRMNVNGYRALVTGASSGIGRELCRLLCEKGASKVIGVGRNADSLRKLISELGSCFGYVLADLSTLDGITKVIEEARRILDRLDLLVNNAGFGIYGPALRHSNEEVVSMTMVNFVAPVLLTTNLLELMNRGSTVVMVNTAGVHVLLRELPIYGATKAALHYASEALRRELEKRGIRLVAVYPGIVRTSFHERAGRRVKEGLEPVKVANAILRAVAASRARVYVPGYLSLLKLLGPFLPSVGTGEDTASRGG